jgi:hypothetical protein
MDCIGSRHPACSTKSLSAQLLAESERSDDQLAGFFQFGCEFYKYVAPTALSHPCFICVQSVAKTNSNLANRTGLGHLSHR